jgi:hypothetical protein
MYENFSSGQKGNVGLGMAIAFFSRKGNTVSLPLTDTQEYDLIVDINGELKKVQVKFTSRKSRNNFFIDLTTRGHVNANGDYYDNGFDRNANDLIFIFCADGTQYLIPTSVIESKTLTFGDKWSSYIVV